jgi:hypothetical protein
MMEATRTFETLVNIQLRTWQYIPEDSVQEGLWSVYGATFLKINLYKDTT